MVTNFCSWAGALPARLSATATADSAPAAYLNLLILHSPHTWDAALLRCAGKRRNGRVDDIDPWGNCHVGLGRLKAPSSALRAPSPQGEKGSAAASFSTSAPHSRLPL